MNYPYGGYGYGYPPQPYAPYPQYPAPPRPGGGTAITAGVLALLGGLWGAVSAGSLAIGLSSVSSGALDEVKTMLVVSLGIGAVVALLLLLGSLLLFLRRTAGRVLVILGCLGAIASAAVSVVFMASVGADFKDTDGYASGLAVTAGISGVMALFPLLTLILAAVPATGRWIAARDAPRYY
ncbi:hypothetical protein ACFYTF_01850 [Nocardia thailandica]|uniref:Major facilitator superfamily (MFS) profile domain-containing protein n=1 Tax=Nocardia thailandica TaxID=257275 RepID=A0ABW6PGN9_9NOCA